MSDSSVAMTVLTLGSAGAGALIAQWITREDRNQFTKYRRTAARSASLLARAALKALLAHEIAEKSWVFSHDSTGKLRVAAPGVTGVEASISHSGDRVACAVSRVGPVGVDIEAHRPRAYDAIARYGFGPEERALVARLGARAFYRIWTLREAMGKATGEGLALVTDGLDRIDPAPEEGCWVSRPAQGPAWRLAHEFVEPGYSLALAVPGAAPDWRAKAVVRVDLLAEAGPAATSASTDG